MSYHIIEMGEAGSGTMWRGKNEKKSVRLLSACVCKTCVCLCVYVREFCRATSVVWYGRVDERNMIPCGRTVLYDTYAIFVLVIYTTIYYTLIFIYLL